MSIRNNTIALVLLAMSSAPAFADMQNDELNAAIAEAVNTPDSQIVAVMDDEGVVTLTGIASTIDRKAAEEAAMQFEGVTEVRNQLTES